MTALDPQDAQPTPPRPSRKTFATLAKLVPFVRPYWHIVALSLVFLIVAAAASLVMPVAFKDMIDHGFTKDNAARIDQVFLALLAVTAVLGVATALRFYFVTWLGERVVADIRKAVFSHILSLSPAFFEVTRTGEVLSRMTSDTGLIQTAVGSSLSIALRNIVMLLGGFVMLAVTSPGLTGLVVLSIPLIVLPLLLMGRSVKEWTRKSQDRVADTAAYASEALNSIQTVQAFTHEREDRKRFDAVVEASFATALKRIAIRATLTGLAITLVFSAIVFVLWTGAQSVLNGTMTPGELGQFVLYAVLVAGSFGTLSEVWSEINQAAGAAERLTELLAITPQIKAPASPAALPSPAIGSVALEGVNFEYPTRPGISALRAITLRIKPGETVALVGPSGAGKTTILQLLLRFFDPQVGRVLLDGADVTTLDPRAVRERISLVAQDPAIFGASAAVNIAYGRPYALQDEIVAAAKAAQAHDFIMALPKGYDTQLGERGVTLSGGQRQRIAIARALLRNAPILLLDEATSALDAESERAVQVALDRLMQDRTTIVIAHRLATVQRADRIVVLDQGRIVAEGTHADLVKSGGLYARLAALQFPGLAAE
jgi:ATP-binding cassette subfamily B protein